jgi:DNA invertase Pin-like site-specific DNA recombinase
MGQQKKPKTFGYLRVSTSSQDTEKFKADILSFSNTHDFGKVTFIDETVSGVKDWKQRKLGELIRSMQPGDRLIVPEMSRLGRSMLDVLEILKASKDKDLAVFAIKGGWCLNGTIESKILSTMLALISEIERDFIISRTREALTALKAQGIKLGRPLGPGKSKLDKYRPEIEAMLKNGSTKIYIAKRYKTTPANLFNWLRKNKINIKPVYDGRGGS